MMQNVLTQEKAMAGFGHGVECSQQICARFAAELGMELSTALRVAAAFGSGMGHGETCGCVSGALMVLGMRYGPGTFELASNKQLLLEKKRLFEQKFIEQHGSLVCRSLLGHDLSQPGELEQVLEKNLFASVCAPCVCTACSILEELLR